jgi:hypothetical protein
MLVYQRVFHGTSEHIWTIRGNLGQSQLLLSMCPSNSGSIPSGNIAMEHWQIIDALSIQKKTCPLKTVKKRTMLHSYIRYWSNLFPLNSIAIVFHNSTVYILTCQKSLKQSTKTLKITYVPISCNTTCLKTVSQSYGLVHKLQSPR